MVGNCDLRWRDPVNPCPKHGDDVHRCVFQEGSKLSHTPFGAGASPQHICECGSSISPDGRSGPPPKVKALLCPPPHGPVAPPEDLAAVLEAAATLRVQG